MLVRVEKFTQFGVQKCSKHAVLIWYICIQSRDDHLLQIKVCCW